MGNTFEHTERCDCSDCAATIVLLETYPKGELRQALCGECGHKITLQTDRKERVA